MAVLAGVVKDTHLAPVDPADPVDVRLVVQQGLDDLEITPAAGLVERGPAGVIFGVGIRALGQELSDFLEVSLDGHLVKRSLPLVVLLPESLESLLLLGQVRGGVVGRLHGHAAAAVVGGQGPVDHAQGSPRGRGHALREEVWKKRKASMIK